jgi:hypothetical protein
MSLKVMRVKTAFCILHSAFCICLGASGFLVAVVGAGEVDAVAYTQPTNADAFISSTNFMASGGLCCTNQVTDGAPLSPDGFIPRLS